MVPGENIRPSLRFSFDPVPAKDGTIRWLWRAYSQSGELLKASESFETISECMEDAQSYGYRPPA